MPTKTATAAETTTVPEGPTLGIQDISNALKIIDFASEQGAFKGWATINQVLAVREKIAAFVAFAQANPDEAPADAPAETPEA